MEKWLGTSYSAPDQLSDEVLTAHEMTREFYEGFVRERAERDRDAPKVGDPAPDFESELVAADTAEVRRFRLADRRGRPVALVFGSYTAPPFRREIPRINEVFEELGADVDFYCVYIHEAHPSDGWQVEKNVTDGVVHPEPTTPAERAELARAFAEHCELALPLLVDDMDNEIDRLYAAMPMRLYLIDEHGTVVFRTIVGSPGFDVESWSQAIRLHVGASPAAS